MVPLMPHRDFFFFEMMIASTQHYDEYVGRVDVDHLLVLDVWVVLLLLLLLSLQLPDCDI